MDITTPGLAASSARALPVDVARDVSTIQQKFPDIAEKITQLWGLSELNHFFDSVMFDERGSRHGFPDVIAPALMRIYKTHISLVPATHNGDIWDHFLKDL